MAIFQPAIISQPVREMAPAERESSREVLDFLITHERKWAAGPSLSTPEDLATTGPNSHVQVGVAVREYIQKPSGVPEMASLSLSNSEKSDGHVSE